MEPKCGFCDLFNEKYHCNNCKLLNRSATRGTAPKKIDCSLEEFIDYIDSNENFLEKYGVGDYKDITLYTGEKIRVILLDAYRDVLADGSGLAPATLGILNLSAYYEMNKERTNKGSWAECMARNEHLPRIFTLLPEVLRNRIRPVIKRTSAGQGSRDIVETVDTLFLFSEIEVFGERCYSAAGEGDQYEYFSKRENRTMGKYKWLRSPDYGDSNSFCGVSGSGHANCYNAYYTSGLVFGFCV